MENEINVLNTIDTVIAKANDLVAKAKNEGIDLAFNYKKSALNEFGYRYILALRKELELVQSEVKELEKSYNAKKSQNALKDLDKYNSLIKDGKLIIKAETMDSNLLKDMASALKNNKALDLVLIGATDNTKVTFVAATSNKYDARMVVKEATKVCGGGGGGKPDLAQAGGKDPSKLDEALKHVGEAF